MLLTALESKYLDTSVAPIYSANTEIEPLIDGEKYFTAIYNAINNTSSGDSVFIVGWQFSPALNLRTGEVVASSSGDSIGALLATKRTQGVDVRIVLNGTLVIYWIRLLPFARNLEAAEFLRNLTRAGLSSPPLADRILFDWSGGNWTGSHHQKATVIRSGNELIAFVGGMDMVKSHWDKSDTTDKKPHTHKLAELSDPWKGLYPELKGKAWGWHDMGVRIRGEAAKGVWENFRHRWEEASTLPKVHWKKHPGDETETPKLFNPGPILATPVASTTFGSVVVNSKQSVQILRSRFKYKIPNRFGAGGVPWKGIHGEPPTPGAFFEVFQVLKKAIGAATKYIYIEDQFLEDMPHLEEVHLTPSFSLFPNLQNAAASRGVKLIFLGSGRSDPDDPVPPLKNQKMTGVIENIIKELPPDKKNLVAVWRLDHATVHSKLVLIDDEFVTIGSANFQSRSMFGIDSELHTAIVAEDDLVKNLRMKLWAEHWILDRTNRDIAEGLKDLDKALALWRDTWYPDDLDFWWRLTGYSPTSGFGALKQVRP